MVEASLLGGIVLLGSFTQRLTGVGFAMVVSPLLVLLLGPVQGVVVTVAFGFALSAVVSMSHLKEIEYRKIMPVLVAAAIGIVPAAVLVRNVSNAVLATSAGSLMLLALGLSVVASRMRLPQLESGWVKGAVGVLSGVMNVVAGAGGPPLAAYALASKWDHLAFAITAQFYFSVLGGLSLLGRWVVPDISGWDAVGGSAGVIGGILLARAAGRRIPVAISRATTLVLALIGSATVLATGVRGLLGV